MLYGFGDAMNDYSINQISQTLLSEITTAIQSVQNFGSVEIFVQKGIVTQITVRNIKKTGMSDMYSLKRMDK